LDAAHEIFQKPFRVTIELEDIDTPKHYAKYPEGGALGPKMQAWRVHKDELPQKNFGLVSDGYGFTDTPDCEYVSSGVNSKGPSSVALGRQGNWFLWGFCAAPSEMTESAKLAFLNTIVYMKRFDGQRALVTKPTRSRKWGFVNVNLLDVDDERTKAYARGTIDASILIEAEGDSKRVRKVLEDNEGWLYWAKNERPESRGADSRPVPPERIAIDYDAKALGIANRDPALLDLCVTMLEKGDRKDVAQRVLERYTDQKHGGDAAAWRQWLEKNQGRLKFTDTGGYRFRAWDGAKTARSENR
jgi:hypothetical protein